MSSSSSAIKIVIVSTAGLAVAVPVAVVCLLRRVSNSVGVAPPTEEQVQEETPLTNSPLIRHLPQLERTLAWRSLGVTKASPIHKLTLPSQMNGKKELIVYVKREDLLSPLYGGNKVRTLQHQLAVCEARRNRGETAFEQLISLGSGGSNQIVACTVHARALGWNTNNGTNNHGCAIHPVWFDKDAPDLDNTLNMLSVLSMPNMGSTYSWNWGAAISSPLKLCSALWGAWKQDRFVPMMGGGNCPTGVLGQVGAMLELAEQITLACDGNGSIPDPQRIYVPIGTACTVSGLVIGAVLARHLKLAAFQDPDFTILGCNVHEGIAKGDAKFHFHTNAWLGFMPLTMTYTIKQACAALTQVGGPDLTQEALAFMRNHVVLKHNANVVGTYGGHSELSRQAAQWYDEHGRVEDIHTGQPAKPLWVCGHFVAKALQPLLVDLEEEIETTTTTDAIKMPPRYMLWMTKSAVQPLGPQDEWGALCAQNEPVLEWANQGKSESPKYRPGTVSTENGTPDDYRSLMTKIL